MNCRKVNNLLSAYIDGELAGVEQLQIRQHLRDCCECNYEHESLLLTKRMLSSLNLVDPAPGLEEKILGTIHGDGGNRPFRFDPLGWWSLLAEGERTRVRTGTLIACLSVLSLLYVSMPAGSPTLAPGQMADMRTAFPVSAAPDLPVRDYIGLHNSSETALPFGNGAAIAPAGDYHTIGPMR